MSDIAKCPLCGKDVKKSIWRPEYEGCAGSAVVTVKCCGMEALTVGLWNRYAAAMELAKLTIQMKTCRAYCPEMAYLRAQDRVLEVFE